MQEKQKDKLLQGQVRSKSQKDPNQDQKPQKLQSDQIDYNQEYYEKYKQLYIGSRNICSQLSQLVKIKQQVQEQLNQLQQKSQSFRDVIRGQPKQKKKRIRRQATEIQRVFKCDFPNCEKSYGTQGCLIQHQRKKHPELQNKLQKSNQQL